MIQIRCHNPQQGHASIAANLWPWVKAQTMAGNAVDIHAGPAQDDRTLQQLRFCEDNIFGQRKNCNRPGGTTYAAFRAGVVERIGEERTAAVEAANFTHKWTHEELIEIRARFIAKRKAKEAA